MPAEAAGLLAAMEAALRGDDEPLRRWHAEPRSLLHRALRRAGFDDAAAEDAVLHLIEVALATVVARRAVERELPWMGGVLTNARRRRRALAAREALLVRLAVQHAHTSSGADTAADHREEIEFVAQRLAPRLRVAVEARRSGLDGSAAHRAIGEQLGVGFEQARKIDRTALAAMRRGLEQLGHARERVRFRESSTSRGPDPTHSPERAAAARREDTWTSS